MNEESELNELKRTTQTDLHAGKRRLQQAGRNAGDAATERLEEEQQELASGVDGLADAVSRAGGELRRSDHDSLASYAGQLAGYLSDLSDTLREKNADELIRDVGGIARKNPALFVLGSVALGLGVSRVVKAGLAEPDNTQVREDVVEDKADDGSSPVPGGERLGEPIEGNGGVL